MKSQFLLAFNEICEEKQLPPETVIEALKTALVSAYRRNSSVSSSQAITADIDPRTGELAIFAEKEVTDVIIDTRTEVTIREAHRLYPEAKIGDMVMAESTPRNFGRIAAQTAKQVILQRVREAERDHLFDEFSGREGEIVNGTVQSLTGGNITIGLGRTEAILPRSQQVYGERYRAHDKIRILILEVRRTNRGPQIIVSRSHRNLLRRLLELEVPEIYNGQVDVKSIAREAGQRSKVAVQAMQPGVDPVGACVGMRGVRIQSIVRELNDEKIDVIEWDADPKNFIAKALSPARVSQVFLDDDPLNGRTATVIVPDDQLSLAIGREGQNARLAAKLTGWRIDIKSLTEAGRDSLKLLGHPAADSRVAKDLQLHNMVSAVIEKKQAGRPITAEDYGYINRLVVGVEGRIIAARAAKNEAIRKEQSDAYKQVPEEWWKLELEELDLPLSVHNLLLANSYDTVGHVAYQMELEPAEFLTLEGFDGTALSKIEERLEYLANPEAALAAETPVEPITLDVEADDGEESLDDVMADIADLVDLEPLIVEPLFVGEDIQPDQPEEIPTLDDLSQSLVSIVKEEPKKPAPKKKPKPKVRVARPQPAKEEPETAGSKRRKGKQLVFDEKAGKVVTKRKRKKNRRQDEWEDEF